MSLLHPSRTETPHLHSLRPRAALPGGSFEISGTHLLTQRDDAVPQLPLALLGEAPAAVELVRPTRAQVRVPEGAIAGDLTLRYGTQTTNALHANVAVPVADDLHMVSNPAVDRDGNLFAMISGQRGTRVPVSIVRMAPDLQVRPFVRDLLNISALAFGPDGYLYASSRAEGIVYRIWSSAATIWSVCASWRTEPPRSQRRRRSTRSIWESRGERLSKAASGAVVFGADPALQTGNTWPATSSRPWPGKLIRWTLS